MSAPGLRHFLRLLGRRVAARLEARHRARRYYRRRRLPDGTRVLIRALVPEDAPSLVRALRELSPTSRYRRFLAPVERLTTEQLQYLTRPDGVHHIALGMAVLSRRRAPLPIAIARCIRDRSDPLTGEVAIVVADGWQGRGAGTLLLQSLAEISRRAGIRRWRAVMLAENAGARRLLERVAVPLSVRSEGAGVVEALYSLDGL